MNALIPAYFAAKKLKCRLIYDSHEIHLENHGIIGNKLQKVYYTFFEKLIIKKCDLMICVSHAAADYFVKRYNIPKPMVVTNCVSKDIICNNADKNPKFEIINHGQFYEGRGYDIMVEATQYLLLLIHLHLMYLLTVYIFILIELYMFLNHFSNLITMWKYY